MNMRLIILLLTLLNSFVVFGGNVSVDLSPEEYEQNGFKIQCVNYDGSLVWVYVSAPSKKLEKHDISHIKFMLFEKDKIVISSCIPLQKIVKGCVSGRFLIRKDMLKKIKIEIQYGIRVCKIFILTIPDIKSQQTTTPDP